MEDNNHSAFTAGVRPGGLTATDEVLVLLCCLLSGAGQPVSFEQLRDALIGQELVNYFEFADMMERMSAKGYSHREEDGYTATQLGQDTARECSYNLPVAVLERAQNALHDILLRARRERENRIEITEEATGWRITVIVYDMGEELLHLSAILPAQSDCERVKASFLASPADFYTAIMSAASGGDTNTKDGNNNGHTV